MSTYHNHQRVKTSSAADHRYIKNTPSPPTQRTNVYTPMKLTTPKKQITPPPATPWAPSRTPSSHFEPTSLPRNYWKTPLRNLPVMPLKTIAPITPTKCMSAKQLTPDNKLTDQGQWYAGKNESKDIEMPDEPPLEATGSQWPWFVR